MPLTKDQAKEYYRYAVAQAEKSGLPPGKASAYAMDMLERGGHKPSTAERFAYSLETLQKQGKEPAKYQGPEVTPAGTLWEGAKGGLQGLGYVGGLARTGIAATRDVLDPLAPPLTQSGDFTRAVKGEAPTTSEYLGRAGMEPGWARTGLGLMGDIATDPTSMGAYAVGKKVGQSAYEKLTRSALKNVDEVNKLHGVKPVSDVVIDRGITFKNPQDLMTKLDNVGYEELAMRDLALHQGASKGAQISKSEVLDEFRKQVTDPRRRIKSNEQKDIAQALDEWVENVAQNVEDMPITEATQLKSIISGKVPQKFYDAASDAPIPEFAEARRTLAAIYKSKIERSANKVTTGLGNKIAEHNSNVSSIMGAAKPMATEAKKYTRTNILTSVDPIVAGATASSPERVIATLAGKKAADFSRQMGGRSRMAGAARGATPWVAPAVQRGAINMSLPEPAPISAWQNQKNR